MVDRADHDGGWLRRMADRCQIWVLDVQARKAGALPASGALLHDAPRTLSPPGLVLASGIAARSLLQIARTLGVQSRPEVQATLVRLATAGAVGDLERDWTESIAVISQETLTPSPPSDVRLRRVLHVIETEYGDADLTLAAVACRADVSRWHLSRLLTRHCGAGFEPLLQRKRVTTAAHLLSTTSLTVKEVAVAVGYKSTTQLGRQFKKVRGLSPSRFARANGGRAGRAHALTTNSN